MIEYESFFAPQNYWDALNRMYMTSYIKKYYTENGVYPTQEQINSIVLSEDEIEKYNRHYYAKYLANGEISGSEHIICDNSPNFSEWIELPSPNDNELEYYCHYFLVNGEKYRNYSFGWSQKDKISKWVAYPLHGIYLENNVGEFGINRWSLDPILGVNSSSPFVGYGKNGKSPQTYYRGLLIPIDNRLYSIKSCSQVFYASTVIPISINVEKIHNILGSSIKDLAHKSNECYVVSGTVIDNHGFKIVEDTVGKNVTAPTLLYKVVLFVEEDSYKVLCCLYKNDYNIINDNKLYGTPLVTYHTINELEEITGICYFPNLKTIIGEKKYFEIKNQKSIEVYIEI